MQKSIKIELITDYIKKNNLSKAQFCKLCNISTYMLNKILSGDINFDIQHLINISNVIKIYFPYFFAD